MTKPSPKQKAHSSPANTSEKAQQLKGVRMRKGGKWVSEVRIPKSQARIWLGSHNTAEQAARAYDCAVYCLRGSKAKLNFPEFLPEIPSAPSLSPAEIQAAAAKHAAKDFRQLPKKDVAFSGSEFNSSIDGRVVLDERNSTSLDSFLQDLESSQFPISEEFSALDVPFEDFDFDFLEELQKGVFTEYPSDFPNSL